MQFSLREFAMVTGLRCLDKVDITGRDLYFDANTTIKFDDLARGFRTMSETANKGVKKKVEKAKKKKDRLRANYYW